MRYYHKQLAYTLIEMMLVLVVSTIVVMAGLRYVRSVYRGHLTNQAEELIIQVLTIAKNYHTATPINPDDGTLNKQYKGIDTTWVANTGNIPSQYIELNDDKTVSILSPWSDEPSIDVYPGSESEEGDSGLTGNDTYLYITAKHLPNYACESLAVRLQGELGSNRKVNDIPITQTKCVESEDEDEGGNVLYILTNPSLY